MSAKLCCVIFIYSYGILFCENSFGNTLTFVMKFIIKKQSWLQSTTTSDFFLKFIFFWRVYMVNPRSVLVRVQPVSLWITFCSISWNTLRFVLFNGVFVLYELYYILWFISYILFFKVNKLFRLHISEIISFRIY